MAERNPTVTSTGWWLWRKTVVEHTGGTSVFSGNARVTETDGSTCVAEAGLLSAQTVCFLKDQPGVPSALPDGDLTGRSKSVELKLASGEVKSFQSSPLGLHSASKEGDQVVIRKAGLFGEREVQRIPADQVVSVTADHCRVCEAVNPLFRKS